MILAGAAVAAVFCAPSSAAAATEFGSQCAATDGEPGYTFISVAHGAGDPLPAAAPVSGVITRWTSNSGLELPPEAGGVFAQRLLLFRATGALNEYTLIAQSDPGALSGPVNTFPTRIPVQAGDFLGISGNLITVACSTSDPADLLAAFPSVVPPAIGSANIALPADEFEIPIAAAIEPDGDGDGYGDETQDGCPQSAAYQTPCPVVVLDGLTQTGAGWVKLAIATSLGAEVKVTGSVKLGKKGKVKFGPKTRTLTPGQITKVAFKFPAKLKKRLKELPPKQKLTLKLTASAPNLAASPSIDKLKVKLKGQGR